MFAFFDSMESFHKVYVMVALCITITTVVSSITRALSARPKGDWRPLGKVGADCHVLTRRSIPEAGRTDPGL